MGELHNKVYALKYSKKYASYTDDELNNELEKLYTVYNILPDDRLRINILLNIISVKGLLKEGFHK